MLIIQILIVGVVACAIFDLWQRVFHKLTAIQPSNWAMVGRWSLGLMTSGQLIARDLESRAERKNELAVGWLVHYSVAIGYAAVYSWLVHATILHLLGIEHEKFTVRHDGIDRWALAQGEKSPSLLQYLLHIYIYIYIYI